jgi:hypothetical protein
MWQYARALDTENAEAHAAVYTPDGQFGANATAVKPREVDELVRTNGQWLILVTRRRAQIGKPAVRSQLADRTANGIY